MCSTYTRKKRKEEKERKFKTFDGLFLGEVAKDILLSWFRKLEILTLRD